MSPEQPPTVVLPPLAGPAHAAWDAILDIAGATTTGWTLIGGQMVLLLGLEFGVAPPRTSRDADILVDIRLPRTSLRGFAGILAGLGFALDGMGPDGVAHRFRRGDAVVDLLCIDHVGARADLTTVPPGRTLTVPGGRQAVERTRFVAVSHAGRTASVPRPSLLGAVIAKAHAAMLPLTPPDRQRHRSDLAFLLSLVPDPFVLREELSDSERQRLTTYTELLDGQDRTWSTLTPTAANHGRATLRVLLRGQGK